MDTNTASAHGLDALAERVEGLRGEHTYPPVEQWDPPRSGESHMRIHRDGSWTYHGSPFTRQGFVRMFSSVLRRDGDAHWLVTPGEKLRIAVDVAPFLVTDFEAVEEGGVPTLVFATSAGDRVPLDAAHPLRVEEDDDGQPLPLLRVRGGMDGLLSRACFYRLVEECARESATGSIDVVSGGERWSLE